MLTLFFRGVIERDRIATAPERLLMRVTATAEALRLPMFALVLCVKSFNCDFFY